jgi:hypothetical protein
MFAVPEKFGELAFDECFLQVGRRECSARGAKLL